MEKKNKPEIRFKRFGDNVQSVKLGNVSVIGDIDHRMPPTVTVGIPYLMTGDFIGLNELDFENAKRISIEEYNQLSNKIKPELGDILFARYASIGAVRYVETNKRFLISYSCAIIKKSDFIFGKYLYYYFQTNKLQYQIEQEINTGSQRNIGIDSLKKLFLNLPPKKDQEKISIFLENIDKLIKEYQQKHAKLKSLKQAMLDKMFPKHGQLVPEIRFKGFKGDWKEKRLGELGEFIKGKGLSKNDVSKAGKYECVLYGHLYTEYEMLIEKINYSTDIEFITAVKSQFGDILFPSSDTTPTGLARAACIEKHGVILGGDINVLRPKETVSGRFLSFNINANRKKLLPLIKGIAVRHIYNSDLETVKIFVPNKIEEQQKIGNYFKNIDELIDKYITQITKLQDIKKAVLAKMFV